METQSAWPPFPLPSAALKCSRTELHRLKTVERPAVITAIAEARAQGDLSENADYDAAKDRQGFIEGRIQEIEGKLSVAQVIDPSASTAAAKWCLARRSSWRTKSPATR
jgi:transcription elongation factor GreA